MLTVFKALLRKLAGHSKRIFDALCGSLTEHLKEHLKKKDGP